MSLPVPIYPADNSLFPLYEEAIGDVDPYNLWQSYTHFKALPSTDYAASSSAVYSTQIEGSTVGMEEFMSAHRGGVPTWWQPASMELQRVEDMKQAYLFAQSRVLSEANLLKAHALLSEHMGLRKRNRGVYRSGDVWISDGTTRIYSAPSAPSAHEAMNRFWEDVRRLRGKKLTVLRAFYHVALAHLVFEKIHPFADGNGRAGRLIEKWLLAAHLGEKAWKIPTEEYYRRNLGAYYDNLGEPGRSYENLDYGKSGPFLAMPARALAYGCKRAREVRSSQPN